MFFEMIQFSIQTIYDTMSTNDVDDVVSTSVPDVGMKPLTSTNDVDPTFICTVFFDFVSTSKSVDTT